MVVQARRRGVDHLIAGLPGAQAVVDILIGHRIGLVEEPDLVEHLAPDVHAGAGGGERGTLHVGGSPVGRLEAVAVVKPLERPRIAHRAPVLDPVVGVEQLGGDDPDVGRPRRRVLQAGEPVAQGDDVGVEQHDIVGRVGGPQPPVDVGGKAGVALGGEHLDAGDRAQRGDVLGAAGVVGDDDPHPFGGRRLTDLVHQLGHVRGVAKARDDDRHRPPVAAIPPARRHRGGAPAPRGEAQQAIERRQPQREDERLVENRANPAVAVGEIDPPRQVVEAARPPAVKRGSLLIRAPVVH